MPRVVIVGGGISGTHAAEELRKAKNTEVLIIQGNRFVEWSVAMTYVLAHPETHEKALAMNPGDFEVPGVEYIYKVVEGVNTDKKQVILEDDSSVSFDVLLIATGFCLPWITAACGVTLNARRAEIQDAGNKIREAKSVVINGGGLIGLELAGDIRGAYPEKMITLLCRDQILKDRPSVQKTRVLSILRKMNIDIIPFEGVGHSCNRCVERWLNHCQPD